MLDETKVGQDPSQAGDPSVEPKGTPTEPGTFTKESEEKAVNDALSAAGRDAKSLTEKESKANQILTEAKKLSDDFKTESERWQDERDKAEREAVQDDKEALKSVETRQAQRKKDDELAKRERELEKGETSHEESVASDLEKIRIFDRTKLAAEVAVAKGVDVDALLKLTKEDTLEAMEATAELLPKKGGEKTPLKLVPSTTTMGKQVPDSSRAKMTAGFDKLHPQG